MERRVGVLSGAGALRVGDHASIGFAGRSEFVEAAVACLRAGLDRGERVVYAASGPYDLLYEDLAALPDRDERLASGALVIRPPDFTRARPGDAFDLVTSVADEVAEARARGFTAQRVVVDVTDVLADEHDRERFERFERLIDERIAAGLRLSLLCCVDRERIVATAVESFGCLHPLSSGIDSTFRLYASGDQMAVWGEVDGFQHEPWRHALSVAIGYDRRSRLERSVDCTDLVFIDHHGLRTMDDVARSWEVRLSLRNPNLVVRRLVPVLSLESIRLYT